MERALVEQQCDQTEEASPFDGSSDPLCLISVVDAVIYKSHRVGSACGREGRSDVRLHKYV